MHISAITQNDDAGEMFNSRLVLTNTHTQSQASEVWRERENAHGSPQSKTLWKFYAIFL